MMAELAKIEARRRAEKIPVVRLCAAAGVGRQTYRDAITGTTRAGASTIARLNRALDRFRTGFGAEAGELAPHAAYKASLVLAAFVMGADARQVMAAAPGKRATLVPEWLAAAQVRRVGFYIANQMLGFTQADLARAAGVTRGAIHEALRALYDERETDPKLAATLARIEEIFE
jgi:transcriptional regulator with XRE-family HTH domain